MIGPRFPCNGIPSMGGGPPGIADFKHEHMQCDMSFAYDAVLFSLGRCTLNHINSVHGSLLMPFFFSLSLYMQIWGIMYSSNKPVLVLMMWSLNVLYQQNKYAGPLLVRGPSIFFNGLIRGVGR